MPSKAKVDESVEVDLRIYGNADDRKIEWKLRRNGRTVDLDDYVDERLYEDGGEISFNEDGRYELIATVKDKTGRTFSGKDTITVEQDEPEQKPVPKPDPVLPTFSFDLPKTAHTDTSIALRTQYGDLSGYEVAWELYTLQGLESNWRAFVEGSLDKNGGSIRFTQAGSYELQAVVKKGCLACQKTMQCVIKDGTNAIVEQMRQADVLVFATPVYFYDMCGQMKKLLDRSNPLFPAEYRFRDIYLVASAAENEDTAIDGTITGLSGWISCFEQAQLAGVIKGIGIDTMGAAKKATEHLSAAYEMGKAI